MVSPFEKLERQGVNVNTANQLMNNDWPQYKSAQLDVTFDGGTLNGIGDVSGTSNPYTMFTVTGIVEMSIIAMTTTVLAGATGTVEVGTAVTTGGLIAQTVGTTMIAKEIWHDATSDNTIELTSVAKRNIVTQDVILTVATADITSGAISFIVRWAPISSDGNVVSV